MGGNTFIRPEFWPSLTRSPQRAQALAILVETVRHLWHLFFLLRGSLGEFFSRSDILGESLKTTTLQQIPFSCRTITVIQNVDKSRLKHSKRAQLASVDSRREDPSENYGIPKITGSKTATIIHEFYNQKLFHAFEGLKIGPPHGVSYWLKTLKATHIAGKEFGNSQTEIFQSTSHVKKDARCLMKNITMAAIPTKENLPISKMKSRFFGATSLALDTSPAAKSALALAENGKSDVCKSKNLSQLSYSTQYPSWQ